MKNIFLFTLILLTSNVFSQELTEPQIDNIMIEYMQFLKDEGYSPSFSETGEIDFKYEGGLYSIEKPTYLSDFAMYSGLNHEDGCTFGTLSAVNAACSATKSTQIWISKSCKTVFIQYTSFKESSTNFKLLFKKALSSVKYGKKIVQEKYSEYN